MSGGQGNEIRSGAGFSTIGGGNGNAIEGTLDGTIAGGFQNLISGGSTFGTIGGGNGNSILGGLDSTIGGGFQNTIDATYATIPGGNRNSVMADFGFAAGRRARSAHQGTFVWGDSTDEDFASTGDNQFIIRAQGGVGIGTNTPSADLDVAGSGWFRGDVGGLPASAGKGVRIFFNDAVATNEYASVFGYDYSTFTPQNMVLQQPGGNLGIGNSSPTARLDVAGDGRFTGGLDVESSGAPLSVDSVNGNCFKIELKENGVTTSYLGSQSHSGVQYAFAVANSNAVTHMVVQQNGFVGIGTNPSHILHINGIGRSTSSTWATSSDERAKENIWEVTGSLDRLSRLRPVKFEYKEEYAGEHQGYDGEYTGFIAQEVEEVFPEMVSVSPDTIGGQPVEDFRVLNTGSMTPHLVSGLQELRAEKDRQIQQLQAENKSLQDRLNQLEKVVQSLMAQ